MKFLFLGSIILGFLSSLSSCKDIGELKFVQVVWRHGDRSPTETFPNDPNQEGNWTQGWGQLTERGMQQHVDLGKTLRKKYVNDIKFLNPQYKSDEIYVRSTDVNRTMLSATANMIAMFPGYANESGYSYPNTTEWPTYEVNGETVGFVPIAIHTLNDFYDYTLNPDSICNRYSELWSFVEQTPEYANLTAEKKGLLDKLTSITGMQTNLTNLWIIADALFIEQTWNKTWVKGIDEAMFNEIIEINDIVEYWNNGMKLEPYQGIDFSIEIPKIRGGSLLWSIVGNFQLKQACLLDSGHSFCPFFKNLKYYAYSAHDTTIAALFSTFALNYTNWNEDGYPHYSSAVAVELWQKADLSNEIRFVYFPLDPADNIGHLVEKLNVPGCEIECTLDAFVELSKTYKPSPDAATLCDTPVNSNPSSPTTTPKSNKSSATSFSIFSLIWLFFGFALCH